MKRNDWVLNRCGMAVLCINMTYWTINVIYILYYRLKNSCKILELKELLIMAEFATKNYN